MSFFQSLQTDSFMQLALMSAVVSGAVCGLTGPLMHTRRLASATGGIAHSVIGGMGFMVWMGSSPTLGAFLAALLVAVILALPERGSSSASDSRIQILWSLGMAIGILFLYKTPGYRLDLMSTLFGNLLLTTHENLFFSLGVFVVGLLLLVFKYSQIEAVCFDEEFARVIGLPVRGLNLAIFVLIAMSVVVLIQSVGLILVMSLMTISASLAARFSHSLWQMIVQCVAMNWFFAVLGLWISYEFDLPSGSTIILSAGAVYCVVLFVAAVRDRFRKIVQGLSAVPH